MKVLITGSSGFVGTATSELLEQRHHTVVPFDLMAGRDICDSQSVAQVLGEQKPDRILHLAAIARFADADHDPLRAFETNVLGTKILSQVAQSFHIPMIYSSTGSVYMPIKGKPPITEDFPACGNSVYGCTKYLAELYLRRSTAPWLILRYAHLYGLEKRHHGLVGGFLERINRGLAPKLYGGLQSNDFTYIQDIAKANLAAVEAPWDAWNQVYNIGTGEELTTEQAGEAVCRVFDYHGTIERVEQRSVDPDRFVFDCSKAERLLGFKADYTFEQGLHDMKVKSGEDWAQYPHLASRKVSHP